MSDPVPLWFETCIQALSDPSNQRVWSVIVSLFGDMAQNPGAQLSGGALGRIIQPMGIRPEAIRVALHRLRKDGWIESARSGRTSVHYLTDFGRARSAEVSPRIYAAHIDIPDEWHLMIADDTGGMAALDALRESTDCHSLTRNVVLMAGSLPDRCDDLLGVRVSGASVPDWVRARLCPPDLSVACSSLLQAARNCAAEDPAAHSPTPDQIATLRTLIVHRWRRVVLRYPDLPSDFYPAGWVGPACRAQVFALLDTLPRPDLYQLEHEVAAQTDARERSVT